MTPLVAAQHASPVPAGVLYEPFTYVLLGPLSSVLDAFTLMSPSQGWAMLATAVLVSAAIKLYLRRAAVRRGEPARTGFHDAVLFVVRAFVVTIAIGELLVAAPRPMASLKLRDEDVLAVDFHSHTSESHDGRPGFDVERNREWQRQAGFDVGYITDHRTFNAALLARQRNPEVAGDGTVLLPGIELRDGAEHDIVLGADPMRSTIPSPDIRDAVLIAEDAGVSPVVVRAMPAGDRIGDWTSSAQGINVAAIEISDASPRGLEQTSRDAARIDALCQTGNIACVSGSDNHGWSRTPAAWSVIRIPHWRDKSPAALDLAIRQAITAKSPDNIQVLMRRRAPPAGSNPGIAVSAIAVALVMFRTLDWAMRISWIVWPWTLVALMAVRKREILLVTYARERLLQPLALRAFPRPESRSDVS